MDSSHPWCNKKLSETVMPPQIILAAIVRDEVELVPRGTTELRAGDILVFGAREFDDDRINLKEVKIKERHEWVGLPLKKINISRQALVLLIRRGKESIIPNGETVILSGDELVIYEKS